MKAGLRAGVAGASRRRFMGAISLGALAACGHGGGSADVSGPSTGAAVPDLGASGSLAVNGASLHYAIDFPTGQGPFPGMVFGHGAGRVTASEMIGLVPMFLDAGFAVIRYDKRGVGESTGTYRGLSASNSDSVVNELADDMAAIAGLLSRVARVDASKLGLFGASQAGWIMPAAVLRMTSIRFFVAAVGSTLTVGQNIFYENLPASASLDDNYAALGAYSGTRGWDPMPLLTGQSMPALWLLGAADRLVPTREVERNVAQLRQTGKRFSAVVYPGVGHELSGLANRYRADMLNWITQVGLA